MTTSPSSTATPLLPRASVRAVVSVLVMLHVTAVFVGPFAMPPSSQLSATVASAMQPYLDVLSLGNGYRFFAPEPGPSHLVRYEATLDDGTLKAGFFPNRAEHWPRLLYHRYFMLTEFANTLGGGPSPKTAEAYAKGYARHVAQATGAKSVKLFLRRHYVPRTSEVQSGMRLDDKSKYEERPLFTYERD